MTTHANPCGAATTWVVWQNMRRFLDDLLIFLNFILGVVQSPHQWTNFDYIQAIMPLHDVMA